MGIFFLLRLSLTDELAKAINNFTAADKRKTLEDIAKTMLAKANTTLSLGDLHLIELLCVATMKAEACAGDRRERFGRATSSKHTIRIVFKEATKAADITAASTAFNTANAKTPATILIRGVSHSLSSTVDVDVEVNKEYFLRLLELVLSANNGNNVIAWGRQRRKRNGSA